MIAEPSEERVDFTTLYRGCSVQEYSIVAKPNPKGIFELSFLLSLQIEKKEKKSRLPMVLPSAGRGLVSAETFFW